MLEIGDGEGAKEEKYEENTWELTCRRYSSSHSDNHFPLGHLSVHSFCSLVHSFFLHFFLFCLLFARYTCLKAIIDALLKKTCHGYEEQEEDVERASGKLRVSNARALFVKFPENLGKGAFGTRARHG